MPDSERKTVSASQVPAVFNVSQWQTRWQLYHWFQGVEIPKTETDGMTWGKRLQRPILEWAAEEMNLKLIEHDDYDGLDKLDTAAAAELVRNRYLRHPQWPIGATPDGFCIHPTNGLGVVEGKNVSGFQYRDAWADGPPLDVELQLQTQMMVPHPEHGLPKWGAIAALIGGSDPQLIMRRPEPEAQAQIIGEVGNFLARVFAKEEPAMTGDVKEYPLFIKLWPRADKAKVMTIDARLDAARAQIVADYQYWQVQKRFADNAEAEAKLKFHQMIEDHGGVVLETEKQIITAKISKFETAAQVIHKRAGWQSRTTFKVIERSAPMATISDDTPVDLGPADA